jgi:hypothetical protein
MDWLLCIVWAAQNSAKSPPVFAVNVSGYYQGVNNGVKPKVQSVRLRKRKKAAELLGSLL